MTKKFLIILLTIVLALIPLVSASDVAYILKDSSDVSQKIITSFSELGLTYQVIEDDQILTTDFSEYSILLITDAVNDRDYLPLNEKNSIFLDKEIAREAWELSSSGTGSTSKTKIETHDESSFVFNEITIPVDDLINIYSPTYLAKRVHYLNPSQATSELERIAFKPSSSKLVIASSIDSGVKNLFFGIYESEHWHDNSKTMFKNSLLWLMSDVDQDGDGFIFSEDCDDQDPLAFPGANETAYDGIDQDCDGFDLTDVDGDGYDSDEVGGEDCDDNNHTINPGNPDLALNCENDAPEILSVTGNFQAMETETVVVEILAQDPEDDLLTYSINDPCFVQLLENTFIWQTTLDDAGTYSFEVTVSDSQLEDTETIEIEIENKNRPPTLDLDIPEIFWEEDSSLIIDLNDYFSDSDGETLTFGIEDTSDELDISVFVEHDGTVYFSSSADFFGQDWIIFYADDGESQTVSNLVALTVTPVPDDVIFMASIPDFNWSEDTNLEDAVSLYEHFFDADEEELIFEVFGNENIDVSINLDGVVSFFLEKDFFGTEEIYFTATDSQAMATSNEITLTVTNEGEAPVFSELTCETEIDEDVAYTCTLEATDFEDDTLAFSTSEEENLLCEIEGNVLTYVSKENYNGAASCIVTVTDDIHGSDFKILEVNISLVNDAPEIISYTPAEDVVLIIENFEKIFSLEIFDPDSEVTISWILNGETKSTTTSKSSEFLFSDDVGIYLLEAVASDQEAPSTFQSWNLIVGPTSDFTCSEVGGFILKEKETCSKDILDVKDTNLCCSVQGDPSFEDADACEIISNDVTIEIEDPEINNVFELGETVRVRLRFENNLEENQKIKAEVYLYNLDEDDSEQSSWGKVKIDNGKSRTLRIDLEIPDDLDPDGNYVIFAKAEDDVCNQAYIPINIERPDSNVKISKFDLTKDANCGDLLTARVKVENLGLENQDVSVRIRNGDLEIRESSNVFELEKFDENDKETEEFAFYIPKDAEPGTYNIEASVSYSSKTYKITKEIEISCKRLIKSETETFNDQTLLLNKLLASEIKSRSNVPIAILFMLITTVASLMLLLYVSRGKGK